MIRKAPLAEAQTALGKQERGRPTWNADICVLAKTASSRKIPLKSTNQLLSYSSILNSLSLICLLN